MGMICVLRRASPGDLQQLLRDPELITSFLHEDDHDEVPSAPPLPWSERAEDDTTDLDKAWHGLHYLFAGTAWEGHAPSDLLVNGGEQIGEVDVGFGPARALLPEDVRRFAGFLASLDHETLRARFDPAKMEALTIYPSRLWASDDQPFDYLWEYFQVLRGFVAATARRGDGLVIFVS